MYGRVLYFYDFLNYYFAYCPVHSRYAVNNGRPIVKYWDKLKITMTQTDNVCYT